MPWSEGFQPIFGMDSLGHPNPKKRRTNMKSEIDGQIEQEEKLEKEQERKENEEKERLQKFGSEENYRNFRIQRMDTKNRVQRLRSKKRSAVMQVIADQGIAPLMVKLRDKPTTESERIEITRELALYCRTIEKIKSNWIYFDQTNEVFAECLDEGLRFQYGEKREEVSTGLKVLPGYDTGQIKIEKTVLRDEKKPIIATFPFLKAIELQREGKIRITENTEPQFTEVIREDKEPEIMPSLRRLNLGCPIEVEGKLSPQAEALQKRHLSSGRFEISVMTFSPMEHEIKRVLKKFGINE
jgi:hypothetical protein